jgi:hypothetical protein
MSHRHDDREDALERTQDFFRLFMVPGMRLCSGGPGPNTFDMLTALENWVEKGQAPKRVIASHITAGVVDRTRPLCVYPKVAVYTGSGSTDDAANFKCRNPRGARHDDWDYDDGNTTTAITTTELKNRILVPHYPGDADGPSRFFFWKAQRKLYLKR